MDNFDIPYKILLAFVLGGVIGLEREINEKKDVLIDKGDKKVAVLGLRTFSLIGGLGALAGIVYYQWPLFSVFLGTAVLLLLSIFYLLDSKATQDYGVTTEVSLIYSFTIGFLLTIKDIPTQLVIAVTIILILLLSRKEDIKEAIEKIRQKEINAFTSFAVLAFVILPFLPNQTYSISDFAGISEFMKNLGWGNEKMMSLELINPFKLWFILVLITGVDIVGYILEKTLGQKKGWLITSLAGGFVSSTATTVGLARESKQSKNLSLILSAAFLANLASFIPIIVLLGSLNPTLLINSIPVLSGIMITLLSFAIFYLSQAGGKKLESSSQKNTSHQIFNLSSALKFVGLFLVISIISKLGLEFFGSSGFLVTSAIGALPGIDAVVINTANLAGSKIDYSLAVWVLILINGVNLIAKSVYSFMQGEKGFALKFLIGVLVTVLVSVIVNIII